MNSVIQDHIASKGCLILDGGLGTAISLNGTGLLGVEIWSAGTLLHKPEVIREIHADYIEAGADIVTTASYQVHYENMLLYERLNASQTDDLLLTSLALANDARQKAHNASNLGSRKFIAASIGCYGAYMGGGGEYRGVYDRNVEQLTTAFHAAKYRTLSASPHCDLVAFETIPCLAEVKAISALLSQSAGAVPAPPCWLALACRSPTLLNSGEEVETAVRWVEDAAGEVEAKDTGNANTEIGVDGCTSSNSLRDLMLGVNCTHPAQTEDLLHIIRDTARKDRILVAYPNRGDVWDAEAQCYVCGSGLSPVEFGRMAVRWYDAGARIIGGCCQTDPSTIRAVADALHVYFHGS